MVCAQGYRLSAYKQGVKERVQRLCRVEVVRLRLAHAQRLLDDALEELGDLSGRGVLEVEGAGLVALEVLLLPKAERRTLARGSYPLEPTTPA